MSKITNEDIKIIYEIAKEVYLKKISLSEGKKKAANTTNMAESSAQDYIYNFSHMMDGTRFTRTNKAYAIEYYLQSIYKDYGKDRLNNALETLKEHIHYYESIRKVNRRKERGLYNKYKLILSSNEDEYEQQIGAELIKKEGKSRKELIEYLKQNKFGKETITVSGEKIKRDNYAISVIKELRGYKCQFCGIMIKKSDDSFYIEAAHIVACCNGGEETPDNIILLCPNHHKEFDLGKRNITPIDSKKIVLSLNGIKQDIDLSINE